jgi:hypothetical protein
MVVTAPNKNIRYPNSGPVSTQPVLPPPTVNGGPVSTGPTGNIRPYKPAPVKPVVKKPVSKPVSKPAKKPVAKPDPMAKYLGTDTTYQSQVAALRKAMNDYLQQKQIGETQYNTDFANRTRDLAVTRQNSREDQQNDFASRGMFISGLQARADGQLLNDFSRRQGDLSTARANFLTNSTNDYRNFSEEQRLSQDRARQEALTRRAMKLGTL